MTTFKAQSATPRSFPLHYPQLPYYLSVTAHVSEAAGVADEGGTVTVTVHSDIHVNREVTLPTSYSEGFVSLYPNRFLAEVLASIIKWYGLTPQPVRYP